jgi:hypothetical protein
MESASNAKTSNKFGRLTRNIDVKCRELVAVHKSKEAGRGIVDGAEHPQNKAWPPTDALVRACPMMCFRQSFVSKKMTCRIFQLVLSRIVLMAVIFSCCTALLRSQPVISASSSTDGNGLYTYTFGTQNPSYIWGTQTNLGFLLPFYGILEVHPPTNWSYFVEDDHYIHVFPNQPVYIGEPP